MARGSAEPSRFSRYSSDMNIGEGFTRDLLKSAFILFPIFNVKPNNRKVR